MTALDHIDIQSHAVYLDGPPHELFAQLRREAPIFRHEGKNPGDTPWFWALTRHADMVTVSRQFQAYSSAAKGATLFEERPDLEIARMLIDLDPPEHTRLRSLVDRGFTRATIKRLGEHYAEVTHRLVGEAVARGEVEFVTEVAAELPLVAIAELLGIPLEDRHKVFDWSNRMIATSDSEYSGGSEDAGAAAAELYMYAQELLADRKAHPRDDIITTLMSSMEGDSLNDHEFNLFVLLLMVAGSETTRNAISHGVINLLEFPDVWTRLQADRSLLDTMVEEVLRWGTPVNMFRRVATGDVELHGQTIRKGESVVMFYASGNRDEDVFADAHTFDPSRSPNPHLAFGGGGPHFCLGANLARLELKLLFNELLDRVDHVEANGEVSRLCSSFINGVKHLPVRLVPR